MIIEYLGKLHILSILLVFLHYCKSKQSEINSLSFFYILKHLSEAAGVALLHSSGWFYELVFNVVKDLQFVSVL